MKKLILTLGILLLLLAAYKITFASTTSLAWDYPSDYDLITAYIVYFSDGENAYHKIILKSDLLITGDRIELQNIEMRLNLHYGTEYSFEVTCYNNAGESGKSNSVYFTPQGFQPPSDVLPEPVQGQPTMPGNTEIISN